MAESNQVVTIPVAACRASEHQQRDDMGDIDALARNIEAVGQLTPIMVVADGESYQIVAGHRRVAALKALGREYVAALVFQGWDDARITRVLFAENTCRKDMSYAERCRGVQEMLQLGDSSETASACAAVELAEVQNYSRGARRVAVMGETGKQASFGHLAAIGEADPEGVVPAEVVEKAMGCYAAWEARRMVAEYVADMKARELVDQLNAGMDKPMAVLKADAGELLESVYKLDAGCEHADAFMVVEPDRFNAGCEPKCTWYCPDASHAPAEPEREQWEINAERIEGEIRAGAAELVADANSWASEIIYEGAARELCDTALMGFCQVELFNILSKALRIGWGEGIGGLLPGNATAGNVSYDSMYTLGLMVVFPLQTDKWYIADTNSDFSRWPCRVDDAADAAAGHADEWIAKTQAEALDGLLGFLADLDAAGCKHGKAAQAMVAHLESARANMADACGEVA